MQKEAMTVSTTHFILQSTKLCSARDPKRQENLIEGRATSFAKWRAEQWLVALVHRNSGLDLWRFMAVQVLPAIM